MAAIPPPLPSRAVPPPLPSRGPRPNPYATPSQFDPRRVLGKVATRDVARAGGQVFGIDHYPNSTNVNRMRMDRYKDADGSESTMGVIEIEFLSGATYQYPQRPIADFIDMVESSSKGRFTYYEVRGPRPSRKGMGIWPSIKVRDGWRSAAEVQQIARSRQPVTAQQKKRTYTRHGKRGGYGAGGIAIR